MNYQVLARKWRPHNFLEVVGQSHVVNTLINALQHNRLHHAYLFTGTRGVGKTTLARILAKAINCENLVDFNPCGVCSICRELDEGRFLDLIEVDAASRTKVEDTRDLLDNAQYAPNRGRYKVYLIDEVHMLSGHSFNALLKTLEEPPPHVKFLLATTDPHKIPVTVLSRCLQFNLKHLLPLEIFTQMEFILGQEAIAFEPNALKLLARVAQGSMRDALSLLDQAIVFGNGTVTAETVNTMLGTIAQQPVELLLTALGKRDTALIFENIAEIAQLTPDFTDVLQQILQVLHRIALVQQLPSLLSDDFDSDMIATLATQFTPEEVQLYYQIALLGQKDLELAPDPRSGFEMVMLRMLTFRPSGFENLNTEVKPSVAIEKPKTQVPESLTVADLSKNKWQAMISEMKLQGMTRELANNCVLESLTDTSCTLLIETNFIRSSRSEEALQKALEVLHRKPLKLIITTQKTVLDTPAMQLAKDRENLQQAAVDNINADVNVQALKKHFNARIVPGSIEPV